jgi:hypothetical protein
MKLPTCSTNQTPIQIHIDHQIHAFPQGLGALSNISSHRTQNILHPSLRYTIHQDFSSAYVNSTRKSLGALQLQIPNLNCCLLNPNLMKREIIHEIQFGMMLKITES